MKRVGSPCDRRNEAGFRTCDGFVGEGGRCSVCGHRYFDITLHDETCAHMHGAGPCSCGGYPDVAISNKHCRISYVMPEGKGCKCPKGKCWASEQKGRKHRFLRVQDYHEWLVEEERRRLELQHEMNKPLQMIVPYGEGSSPAFTTPYTVTQKKLTLKSEDMPEKMFASTFQRFVEREDE